MSFIKNLTDNLTKVAEITAQKTGEVSETAKLKIKEAKLTGEADDIYEAIGKLVYKQYKEQTDEAEAIAAKCVEADQKNAELAAVAAKIAEVKAVAEQQKAQRKAAAEAAKAAPAEEPAPAEDAPVVEAEFTEAVKEMPEEESTVVCPGCGKTIPASVMFCPDCGQKQGE